MKLEAIDPLNLGNICVATICKVSPELAPQPQDGFRGGRLRQHRALRSVCTLSSRPGRSWNVWFL